MERPFQAIVTGATGINGVAIFPERVRHHSIDLIQSSPEQIAEKLHKNGVTNITYAFYAAYKEESNEVDMCKTNGTMLKNFVLGLEKSNSRSLRRVVLTTGLKYYGLQFGASRLPLEESDGRIPEDFSGHPNFYYTQEDILKEISANKQWDYVIVMPSTICGASQGSFMNHIFTIYLYAIICKELNEPFYFPGNEKLYMGFDDISYSVLIADFEVWVSQKREASKELYNIVNGDVHSWSKTWPKIADYFNLKVPKNQFNNWSSLSDKMNLSTPPPLKLHQEKLGLRDVSNSEIINHMSLSKWVQQDKVKKAWKQIAERKNLEPSLLDAGTWKFTDFTLGKTYNVVASMAKARKLGYHGYYDNFQAFKETFDTLKRGKVIPS
ncbi:hypothetical protein SPOG_03612 [Schizosaccharomyces cryophilus OY26]|uniref:PRISE-like Rossmann-fold domain-containing protein n=1 Tax=Schizosaccharomyces cryophilus (strain OY26 / ATCC MYA-4695 / CBS 11777 / NBRC 106824 / NRRL Y48691) TaxID=653667 RepID=S9XHB0_SCHCR|nr:uncharacterized protein SPOG_03612 [Schizosaccharomyces cryophilus OY26]EPY53061.1 hypothetical protein SPOG_03612 [Schizosaccharomyces cryophilus OY26]